MSHRHWYPPLFVLTDCWCIRLQSGVAIAGVVWAFAGACAFAFHVGCFIMGLPPIGEQEANWSIEERYNISMFAIYKMFWASCTRICGDRYSSQPLLQRKYLRILRRFWDDYPAGYRPNLHENARLLYNRMKEQGFVNPYRMHAGHLIIPHDVIDELGVEVIERYFLDKINLEDPVAMAAADNFWNAWEKAKVAMAWERTMKDRKTSKRIKGSGQETDEKWGRRNWNDKMIPRKYYENPAYKKPEPGSESGSGSAGGIGQYAKSDPCWHKCIYPRVRVDIAMNYVRLKLIGKLLYHIHTVNVLVEVLGTVFGVLAMIVGPMVVCGCVHNIAWKFIPFLAFAAFYAGWCLGYIAVRVSLLWWFRDWWEPEITVCLVVGIIAFALVLAVLAIVIVASYYFMIFPAGYYLYHFPRTTQLVVSGRVD